MPKAKKTHKLWTFQSVRTVRELQRDGIIEACWDGYIEIGTFTKSYRWMVKQMAEKGISCTNAPIWAWHSCTTYKNGPKLVDARCLLSDRQLEYGIQTIEFECPADLVLLSTYGTWNMMLCDIFPSKEKENIDEEIVDKLFATARKQFRKYDSIQATLPYLKVEWVKEIRGLNLKPGDFDYNADEEV